ncbi:hypothetical protein GQ600_21838 [Phytophthora cactorum]|nr:hypothetical protein GQ600_21838 [Phytophthora cactorum]
MRQPAAAASVVCLLRRLESNVSLKVASSTCKRVVANQETRCSHCFRLPSCLARSRITVDQLQYALIPSLGALWERFRCFNKQLNILTAFTKILRNGVWTSSAAKSVLLLEVSSPTAVAITSSTADINHEESSTKTKESLPFLWPAILSADKEEIRSSDDTEDDVYMVDYHSDSDSDDDSLSEDDYVTPPVAIPEMYRRQDRQGGITVAGARVLFTYAGFKRQQMVRGKLQSVPEVEQLTIPLGMHREHIVIGAY